MENQKDPEDQQQNGQNQQQNNQDGDKKYQAALDMVAKIVGGKANLYPEKKVDADTTAAIVADLFKEEKEALILATKEGLKLLLKKHVEVESEIAKEEKKLEALKGTKRKEFTQAAQDWLKKIDQNAVQQTSYATALKVAFGESEEAPPVVNTDDKQQQQ